MPTCEPTAPAWLSAGAKKQWPKIRMALSRLGVFTPPDEIAAGLLAAALDTYLAAEAEIKKHGAYTKAQHGGRVRNPAVPDARAAWEMVLKACREFGLTPSARSNVSAHAGGAKKEEEGIESILKTG